MNSIFIKTEILDGDKISYEYVISRARIEKVLKGQKTKLLKDMNVEIKDGTRIKKKYVQRDGIKIIGPGDVKNSIIYANKLRSVREEGLKEKDFIQEADILITTAGKSGQIVYLSEGLEGSVITCDIAKLRFKNRNDAVSVYHFLKSELGKLQLNALKIGASNRILLEDIGNIKIPVEMKYIDDDLIQDIELQVKYNGLYTECINMFEKNVQYDDSNDELKKIFHIKGTELETLRLDVEHYSYYQSELLKLISRETDNIKWDKLGELIFIKRAIKPEINENQEINYFTLKDIDSDLSVIHNIESDKYSNLSNRMRYIVNEGDIVTAKAGSTTGTNGHISAVITKKFSGMLTTDAFFNIIPKKIDPYYLLFLLKQPVILKQIAMFTSGTTFKMIIKEDFENLRIPRLDTKYEEIIAENMKRYILAYEK